MECPNFHTYVFTWPITSFCFYACNFIDNIKAFNNFTKHRIIPVSYTHLRAHETVLDLVCRLLLEKKILHDNNSVLVLFNSRTTYER